jgi:hypothetical protein
MKNVRGTVMKDGYRIYNLEVRLKNEELEKLGWDLFGLISKREN